MLNADEKDLRRQQILLDFLGRRSAGESVDPAAAAAAHPDLMPELAEMLQSGMRMLRDVVTADQLPGQIRGYTFKREISRGGQGCVFEAVQESTGQRVAIKLIRPLSRHSLARFEREIAALASIKHPGVVSIIDCGRMVDGAFYLVMEFVDGQDFDVWIESCRTHVTTQQTLIATFIAICDAVAAAHRLGIVHRDLKPGNIRIDTAGRPRIIDFGLAALRDDLNVQSITQTGNIVGSVAWASPEQIRGTSTGVTATSDVYSLGVIFFHALTGQHPYDVHGSLIETAKNISDSRPRSLKTIKGLPFGSIEPAVEAVLMSCLEKDPIARPADAAGLTSALQARRVPRRVTRRLPRAAAVVVASLATALTLLGGWVTIRPESGTTSDLAASLPVFQNHIGMRFRSIPSGWYRIGSRFNEPGRKDDEREQAVELQHGIRMAETEVTIGQFRQVMSLPQPARDRANLPVDEVSWSDARDFCERLGVLDGHHYRLPTETEWEICCRAGTGTAFSINKPAELIWWKQRSGGTLHDVATSTPNAWGLFDFHGNVAEWTADTRFGSELQPTTAPDSAGYGLFRVVRGGSFQSELNDCRSASRRSADSLLRHSGIGFRVLLEK